LKLKFWEFFWKSNLGAGAVMRKYLYLFKPGPKPGEDGLYRVTAEEIARERSRRFFWSILRSLLFGLGGFVLVQLILRYCLGV